jgi:putative oxidoreductase
VLLRHLSKSNDLGKLILRLGLAAILLFHGIHKINHGVAWIKPRLAQVGLPGFLAYGTYLAEVLAPIFLIVGYRVRLAALIIAFDMVMAVFLVLRHETFSLSQAPGGAWAIELQALIFLAAVAIAFLGSGTYAISRRNL